MTTTYTQYSIKDLLKKEKETLLGQRIKIQGWVKTQRKMNSELSFLTLNDGSTIKNIQVIIAPHLKNFNELVRLTTGSSIKVEGVLVASIAKGQDFELKPDSVEIFGSVEHPESYPIPTKKLTLEHLREHAHLRVITNLISSVMRIRHTLSNAIHNFFNNEGFFWCSTPLITASDTEGAGEMFKVSTLDLNNLPRNEQGLVDYSQDFFGKEAFLTVSGQLNAETYACALGKVYTFGPTFRAENSNTSRHLAEFWMVEPEVAFADLEDNAKLAERMLKFIFKSVLDNNEDELAFLSQYSGIDLSFRLKDFVESEFKQIDYTKAIDILLKAIKNGREFENEVYWGIDLNSEHERFLAEEYFKSPVVVKNYPKDIKAFYMRLNDDGKTVAAMDVLAPGIGEIIGGSQREERLEVLEKRMEELGLKKEDYSWYLDLRKYGSVPHSGFGLGFERIICYVCGLQNIREAIHFPRSPNNASF